MRRVSSVASRASIPTGWNQKLEVLETSPEPQTFGTASTSMSASSTTVSPTRSEEHTSELQSLMRISYAVFCLKKKKKKKKPNTQHAKLKNTITQTKKTKKSNIKLEKRKQTKSAINHTYRTKVDKHKTT